MNNRSNQLGEDMIVCPYNRFHVMLRHRLGKHVLKCHPEETRAKQQQIFKEKMAAWEKEQKQQVPIQPPVNGTGLLLSLKSFGTRMSLLKHLCRSLIVLCTLIKNVLYMEENK
ncbi:hypothetical protein FQR65_LT15018 [Abscondita terminalis]|nr:hypothetical protein FQR65_LT15110 [Abscondita terminalis]KAF5280697.1 hypothetical protein FQR65_LT15018 [Abscondita terminalis]